MVPRNGLSETWTIHPSIFHYVGISQILQTDAMSSLKK